MFTRSGLEITSGIIQKGKIAGFIEDRYCPKCGGKGYGGWFPDGGVCYMCGGSGGYHKAFVKLYTEEQLKKLNDAAEKRIANKLAQIEAEKAANKKALMDQYGDLIEKAKPFTEQNSFLNDIIYGIESGKFNSLTEKQVSAIEKTVARIKEQEEKKKIKGDAPLGKQVVSGTILTVKRQNSPYGIVTKMLVELDNLSTVWGTCSDKLFEMVPCIGEARDRFNEGDLDESFKIRFRGVKIQFKAEFFPANGDTTHSFFKRPSQVTVLNLVSMAS